MRVQVGRRDRDNEDIVEAVHEAIAMAEVLSDDEFDDFDDDGDD